MGITDKQRLARQRHLGSSDAPRIVGVSPWGGPNDVYFEKIMPPADDEPTEAMETGNRLEPVILDWAAEELGVKLLRNQFRVGENGIMAANCDALMPMQPTWGMEAKYVGPNSIQEWGEPGTDQVPTYVAAQVQHQMYVAELSLVWVPCFMAKFRPAWEMYCVERDQAIIDDLVEAETVFWQKHVLPKTPPDPMALPPLELLKRMKREPASVIDLTDVAVPALERLAGARAIEKEAKNAIELAQREVLSLLGEAEAGRLPDGRIVTYLEQTRKGYTVEKKTFRVLKIKGGAE